MYVQQCSSKKGKGLTWVFISRFFCCVYSRRCFLSFILTVHTFLALFCSVFSFSFLLVISWPQVRRAAARRIGTTYAYDFLGLMEVGLVSRNPPFLFWELHFLAFFNISVCVFLTPRYVFFQYTGICLTRFFFSCVFFLLFFKFSLRFLSSPFFLAPSVLYTWS